MIMGFHEYAYQYPEYIIRTILWSVNSDWTAPLQLSSISVGKLNVVTTGIPQHLRVLLHAEHSQRCMQYVRAPVTMVAAFSLWLPMFQ